MHSPTGSSNQHHANKQYGNEGLTSGSRQKHHDNPSSAHFDSYDPRDNDPNSSSYDSMQAHAGNSRSGPSSDSELYGSGSGSRDTKRTDSSSGGPSDVLPQGASFPSYDDTTLSAKHQQQHQGTGYNQQQQQQHGAGYNQQQHGKSAGGPSGSSALPPGASFQSSDDYLKGVKQQQQG
ncbi:unnamed protein product, partial [Globisporangium polare]